MERNEIVSEKLEKKHTLSQPRQCFLRQTQHFVASCSHSGDQLESAQPPLHESSHSECDRERKKYKHHKDYKKW